MNILRDISDTEPAYNPEIGKTYFNLFQLITIYNLLAFKKKKNDKYTMHRN